MPSMPACEPSNSVVEPELRDVALRGIVTTVEILETRSGSRGALAYFVTVRMQWSGTKVWYLTTRRQRDRPRLFRQLAPLLELLRDIAPDPLTLRRDVELPVAPSDTNSDASVKRPPAGE